MVIQFAVNHFWTHCLFRCCFNKDGTLEKDHIFHLLNDINEKNSSLWEEAYQECGLC